MHSTHGVPRRDCIVGPTRGYCSLTRIHKLVDTHLIGTKKYALQSELKNRFATLEVLYDSSIQDSLKPQFLYQINVKRTLVAPPGGR